MQTIFLVICKINRKNYNIYDFLNFDEQLLIRVEETRKIKKLISQITRRNRKVYRRDHPTAQSHKNEAYTIQQYATKPTIS